MTGQLLFALVQRSGLTWEQVVEAGSVADLST
jgi:hypothetical protein